MTATSCQSCGRKLTSAASIAAGRGRTCARIARQRAAAEAAGFSSAAIDKARQLITDRAIVPVRGRRVFAVVGSNGVDRYLASPQACNCPAGLRGKYACYHRTAATMLAAAGAVAAPTRKPIAVAAQKAQITENSPLFKVQMWKVPRRRRDLYAPEGMRVGATITWTHRYPDGRTVERTGQVWSLAPMSKSVWVVPDQRLTGDLHSAVVVQQSRDGGLLSENLASSPTGNLAVCAAIVAYKTRVAKSAGAIEIPAAA
jgi:uncharacterized protein DUF6011